MILKLLHKFMPRWICYTCRESALATIQGKGTEKRLTITQKIDKFFEDAHPLRSIFVVVMLGAIFLPPFIILITKYIKFTTGILLG